MAETKTAAQTQPVVVTQIAKAKLTLAEVRSKLDGKTGRRFWKNLDELAETEEFHELMREEFPRQAGANEWVDAVSRRGFLKVMGASLALAGLAGCTKQRGRDDLSLYQAAGGPGPRQADVLCDCVSLSDRRDSGAGEVGRLPADQGGRQPRAPDVEGQVGRVHQATLLEMYDPDRSQHVVYRGENSTWGAFQQAFTSAAKKTSSGQGIYFLSETITSPTLAEQWKQCRRPIRMRSWHSGSR